MGQRQQAPMPPPRPTTCGFPAEYSFAIGRRRYAFDPETGRVRCPVGGSNELAEDWHGYLRAHGRAFATPTEANAFAVAHHWPNWMPLAE
jgi:hypothetical protein